MSPENLGHNTHMLLPNEFISQNGAGIFMEGPGYVRVYPTGGNRIRIFSGGKWVIKKGRSLEEVIRTKE